MAINYEQYNDDVKAWGGQVVRSAKSQGISQGIAHVARSPSKSPSLNRLKDRYRFGSGVINKVSISFPRSLIYTMKGAGKGIGGSKGSRWINAKGENKRTDSKSLNKIGSGARKQKDFLTQALDGLDGVERLADIASEALGSVVIDNIFIK